MKIGVIANGSKPHVAEFLTELIQQSRLLPEIELLWEEATAALIHHPGRPLRELLGEIELLLIAGGDGSLLEVARQIHPAPIPLLGINLGRLGFLTALRREELRESLKLINQKKFELSSRTVLETFLYRDGTVTRHFPAALNDVVIVRGEAARLVRLRASQEDRLITEYVADGLIVATPTGSTAYSLSAGGPVVSPNAEVFVLTPICPHTLTNRSLVLQDNRSIVIDILETDPPMLVQFDGQSMFSLLPGDKLEIKRHKSPILLAYLEEYDFFKILRVKLKWSGASV